MSYRSERFQRGFLSLDRINDGDAPEKRDILSDHGDGARQIRSSAERDAARRDSAPFRATREEMLAEARRRLVEAGLKRLVPVLDLVVANGSNRRESITQLCRIWRRRWAGTRRNYYRGVQDLLRFFSANKIKGEMNS